jgi:CheY-like chemotaxis protein
MKILVVEDDRKVAGFIEQGLKEEGHVVDVAPDGDEATMLAHVYDYDIILLDVVLPKKNGFQVATELRREGLTPPRTWCAGSTPAPTTTWPSPSASTSCWPASGRCTGAAAPSASTRSPTDR